MAGKWFTFCRPFSLLSHEGTSHALKHQQNQATQSKKHQQHTEKQVTVTTHHHHGTTTATTMMLMMMTMTPCFPPECVVPEQVVGGCPAHVPLGL
jgi:uncharacterized membrane protein